MVDEFFASWERSSRSGRTMLHWFDRGVDRQAACGAGWAGRPGWKIRPASTDNLCASCEVRLRRENRRLTNK